MPVGAPGKILEFSPPDDAGDSVAAVLEFVQRGIDGVSESVAQGERRRNLPSILGEHVIEERLGDDGCAAALAISVGEAEQEVHAAVAGGVAGPAEAERSAVDCVEGVMHVEAASIVAKLESVVANDLGKGVVELRDLIDARLRSVGAEAQREAYVGASDADGGNALGRGVLGMDFEPKASRIDSALRLDRVVVEPGVVSGEIVHRAGVELVNVVARVLLNGMRADVAETGQRGAGKRQGLHVGRLVVDEQSGDLVGGIGREVDAPDVLVIRQDVRRVKYVAVGAAVGLGNVFVHQGHGDRIEGRSGHYALEVIGALSPGFTRGRASRD